MRVRFRVLRLISTVYKVLGVVVLVIGVILSFALSLSAPQPLVSRIGAFLALLFGTVFYAILLYAVGEFITLTLAIEENTRETRDLLKHQA